MKKLYYVVKKELQDIDGFEETTGHKTVSTYSAVIKDGAPEIEHQFDVELSNEDNSIEGISDYLIDNGMGDEKFEFIELLNKDVYYLYGMKYYINKTSGNIIGISNMREVIKHPTEKSLALGFKNYSYEVVYDMICPNYILGEGIKSFCITYRYLKDNYKRIKREIALEKYPEFNQYRHHNLIEEGKKRGIDTLKILQEQRF